MTALQKDRLIFPTKDAEPCDVSYGEDFELRISDTSDDNDSDIEYDENENIVSQSHLSKDLNRLNGSNRKICQESSAVPQCCCYSTNDAIHSMLYKILSRLLSAKVVLQKLPESVIQQYCSNSDETSETKPNDRDDQSEVKYWRHCPKCNRKSEGSTSTKCQKCQKNVLYECKKCNKRLTTRNGMIFHLKTICDFQGYHYCTECDYKNARKAVMKLHMKSKHPNVQIKDNKATKRSKAKGDKSKVKAMAVQCCIKCNEEIYIDSVNIYGPKICKECGSLMVYKCLNCCEKLYSSHHVIVSHLKACYDLKEN